MASYPVNSEWNSMLKSACFCQLAWSSAMDDEEGGKKVIYIIYIEIVNV